MKSITTEESVNSRQLGLKKGSLGLFFAGTGRDVVFLTLPFAFGKSSRSPFLQGCFQGGLIRPLQSRPFFSKASFAVLKVFQEDHQDLLKNRLHEACLKGWTPLSF